MRTVLAVSYFLPLGLHALIETVLSADFVIDAMNSFDCTLTLNPLPLKFTVLFQRRTFMEEKDVIRHRYLT